MQHGGVAVGMSDNTAANHASSSGNNSAGQQADGILSSVAEQVSSEKIQSLDRSPQRGSAVKGRRDSTSSATVTTTNPSHVNVSKYNESQRNTELRNGSLETTIDGQDNTCSPAQGNGDSDNITVDCSSVISHERGRMLNSGRRRPSGHVSDSASGHTSANDRHSRRAGTRRTGYVSDTTFTAIIDNAANESLRNTALEGA